MRVLGRSMVNRYVRCDTRPRVDIDNQQASGVDRDPAGVDRAISAPGVARMLRLHLVWSPTVQDLPGRQLAVRGSIYRRQLP